MSDAAAPPADAALSGDASAAVAAVDPALATDAAAAAAAAPPAIKGTIQTTLELTFPELYKAVLLPSDVVNQRVEAERAAEEELQWQIKSQETRKTERVAAAEAARVQAEEAKAAAERAAAEAAAKAAKVRLVSTLPYCIGQPLIHFILANTHHAMLALYIKPNRIDSPAPSLPPSPAPHPRPRPPRPTPRRPPSPNPRPTSRRPSSRPFPNSSCASCPTRSARNARRFRPTSIAGTVRKKMERPSPSLGVV